jgi:ferredoxin
MKPGTLNSDFAEEIKKYGAKDFNACFNCGNCTAVCGLTEKNANFPRMFIRYGLLGLTDEILKSKELWLCYSCGDCSAECPRQAAPGDYMAALRRYAIASYEPTGLTKLIFKSNPFYIIFTLLLSVILGFFLLTLKPEHEVARWIFNVLPYEIIHSIGIIIFIITGISVLWGVVRMWIKLSNSTETKKDKQAKPAKSIFKVINEIATMNRYKTCDTEEDSFWKGKHVLLQPWFVHWSIMWGFIGLFVATALDFIFKDPATSIWLPTRILGTLAGIFLVYGAGIALYYRIKKITKAYEDTKLADWVFLSFLFIAGITGFWLELAVAFNANLFINHIILLLHTIISMELVLLFAFSKFAHAIYRPLALFFYYNKN